MGSRLKPPCRCRAMAERQGFEPWIPCGIHAFQACAFSHSAISPQDVADFQNLTQLRVISRFCGGVRLRLVMSDNGYYV